MGNSIKNERGLLLLCPIETLHYVLECLCDSIVMRKFTLFNSIPVQTLWAQKFHLNISIAHLSSEANAKERGEKQRLLMWVNKANLALHICVSLGKKLWRCSDFVILVHPEMPVKHGTHFYMLQISPWHVPVCHFHTEI